ncbi:hypothetical protein MTR_1g060730 [Medicago truncatula]|uniref:Uncharacterized protein n=1 Tax=Medicago truncatula TaxID=3880 RepID=A0A072VKW3_MEDTR|nr:hypothetical protein MTR_1g060730 [Medicago truncatula]
MAPFEVGDPYGSCMRIEDIKDKTYALIKNSLNATHSSFTSTGEMFFSPAT